MCRCILLACGLYEPEPYLNQRMSTSHSLVPADEAISAPHLYD